MPPPWPEQPPPSLECEGTSIGGAPGAYDGLVTATDCRCAFCALAQRGKERTFPGSSPRHCFPTQKIRAPALRAAIYCGKHRIRAPRPGQGALFERPATHSLVTATGSLWHSGTQQAQLFHSQSGSGRHSEVITTWLRGVQKTSHNMHAPKNHEKTNASIPQLRSGLRKSSIRALVPKLKVTMAPQPCTNQHLGHRTASRRRP